jgi:hypothetical protein
MKMNALIPMLPVRSMPASVEFYRKLGFGVESRNCPTWTPRSTA